MHNYRQQVVINDRFGPVQTSVDVLVQINSEPSSFSIEYLDWNPEKEDYIARLAMVFGDYVVEADKAGSSYDYVAIWRFLNSPKNAKFVRMALKSGNASKR